MFLGSAGEQALTIAAAKGVKEAEVCLSFFRHGADAFASTAQPPIEGVTTHVWPDYKSDIVNVFELASYLWVRHYLNQIGYSEICLAIVKQWVYFEILTKKKLDSALGGFQFPIKTVDGECIPEFNPDDEAIVVAVLERTHEAERLTRDVLESWRTGNEHQLLMIKVNNPFKTGCAASVLIIGAFLLLLH